MKKILLCAFIALGIGFILAPISSVYAEKSKKSKKSKKKSHKKISKFEAGFKEGRKIHKKSPEERAFEHRKNKLKLTREKNRDQLRNQEGQLRLGVTAERAKQALSDLPASQSGPFTVHRQRSEATVIPEFKGQSQKNLADVFKTSVYGTAADTGPASSGKGGSVLSDVADIAGSAAQLALI